MVKPTAQLNQDIINFVMNDPNASVLLHQRDIHPQTFGVKLHCEFFRRNPNNPAKSAYRVIFIYDVTIPGLEGNDDVSFLVEVFQGPPVTYTILSHQVY